jgi:TonB family protein
MSQFRIRSSYAFSAFLLVLCMPTAAQTAHISHFVSPQYPPLARQAMIAGQVTLKVDVAPDGTVMNLEEESSAHRLLAQEAKSSVNKCSLLLRVFWSDKGTQSDHNGYSEFHRPKHPSVRHD